MTTYVIPPSRGDYPVTFLTFNGGNNFVAVDNFDVFF